MLFPRLLLDEALALLVEDLCATLLLGVLLAVRCFIDGERLFCVDTALRLSWVLGLFTLGVLLLGEVTRL